MQHTENKIGYVLIVHITAVYVCANSALHSSLCCSFDFSFRDLKKVYWSQNPQIRGWLLHCLKLRHGAMFQISDSWKVGTL